MEIVAAAFGVADVAARSSKLIWRLCDSWRDAPHDVFQLRDDLGRAAEFYSSLVADVTQYAAAAGAAAERPPTITDPERTTTTILAKPWASSISSRAQPPPPPRRPPPHYVASEICDDAESSSIDSRGQSSEVAHPTRQRNGIVSSDGHDHHHARDRLATRSDDLLWKRHLVGLRTATARHESLLELIRTGMGVVGQLESIIQVVVLAGADGKSGDGHDMNPDLQGQQKQPPPPPMALVAMGARRKMIWLAKGPKSKKLRAELSKNMMLVSTVLVAINTSTTSQVAESVAGLSRDTNGHYTELKQTMLQTTGALATVLDTTTHENRTQLARIENRLQEIVTQRAPKNTTPSSSSSVLVTDFSTSLVYCDSSCPCQCHHFRDDSSWSLSRLSLMLGYLRVSSSRLRLSNTPCNWQACSQNGRSAWYMAMLRLPLGPRCGSTTVRLYCSFLSPAGFDFNLRVFRHLPPTAVYDGASIFYHIHAKNLDGMRRVLARHPHAAMDTIGDLYNTPFLVAVYEEWAEGVLLLLRAGADPFYAPNPWMVPFDYLFNRWLAGKEWAGDLMRDGLVRKYYSEFLDTYDFSDLEQIIIGEKHMDIASALANPILAAQAQVPAHLDRATPLRLAARKGDAAWVRALLGLGLDPDDYADGARKEPILWNAVLAGHLGAVRALIEGGADVNARARRGDGLSPLHLAVDSSRGSNRHVTEDMIDLLVRNGADPDILEGCGGGYTPLLRCGGAGSAEAAARLLHHGADPNLLVEVTMRGEGPGNPLREGIQFDHVGYMRALLEAGADWRYVLPDGRTILHELAFSGSVETISLCREWKMTGLQANLEDGSGVTPLDVLNAREDLPAEVRDEFLRFVALQDVNVKTSADWDADDESDEEFHDALDIIVETLARNPEKLLSG